MRNKHLIAAIVGFILALLLTRTNTPTIAANAPTIQKWEYAILEEGAPLEARANSTYYAWRAPGSKLVWDDNFPDFYKKMGGKGDATAATNSEFYNLLAAEGWEYVGREEALSFRKMHEWVFKRPAK